MAIERGSEESYRVRKDQLTIGKGSVEDKNKKVDINHGSFQTSQALSVVGMKEKSEVL
jgi:hypothetical protein